MPSSATTRALGAWWAEARDHLPHPDRDLVDLGAQELHGIALAFGSLSARAGVPVQDLPAWLGRPRSTPAKLVDEYLWTRVTRG